MQPDPAIVGVIHLPALPGTARNSCTLPEIVDHAIGEARLLAEFGFGGIVVENFGDAPFARDCVGPHIVASMTHCVAAVTAAVETAEIAVGVNVLRNDGCSALAIAHAAGGSFVRVNILSGVYATDQGVIEGRAADLLALRSSIGATADIYADIHVKHARAISQPDLELAAEETAYRAGADALILTGTTTGRATDLEQVRRIRGAIPDRPLWVGSGVTPSTISSTLATGAGVIVGSCLRQGGRAGAPLDKAAIIALMEGAAG
jgi:hypothetical protein